MSREFPGDTKIKETFLKAEKDYPGKSIHWHLRITADELKCPKDYCERVLRELEEKGEL